MRDMTRCLSVMARHHLLTIIRSSGIVNGGPVLMLSMIIVSELHKGVIKFVAVFSGILKLIIQSRS